ncbi:MAG: catechol 2,3-dioxygenase-like lactoylglutathione lyase family enzyme [Acidimicrobiales bacterium]|jgi:catechol 2,3-dioxygenase-like lactoylglutathione lyase family enzyme
MAITHIFHVNVNCSDLDVSKAFYESLGFQSVLDLPTGGDANLAAGLDLPNCNGRATIMMLDPEQPRQTRLDLLEWVEPRDPQPPYEHLGRLGIARIALRSTDLTGDYERLSADGVEFLSPPTTMGAHTLFVCMKDPDGSIIELIEFITPPSAS